MTARLLTIEPEPLDAARPNRAHINEHLYALFAPGFVKDYSDASWIEIAFADMKGDGTPNAAEHFSPFDLEKAAAYAEKKNLAGFNLYVGVSLRQGETGPSGRSSGNNFLAATYAWADFDGAGDYSRINDILKEKNLPVSMIVMTGRTPHERAHLYFRLDGTVTKDQVRNANIALKKLLDTDDVEDVCRVMRLAGTVSYPTEAKRARGYVPELVTLHIRKNMPCYAVERLTGFAPQGQADSTTPGRTDDEIVTLLEASHIKGKWHNSVREAIASMIGRGWTDLQIRLACAPYCKGGANDPDLDDLINRARAKWNKPEDESATAAEIEILRLAKLPAIKYEQERKAASESLGFRTSMLDHLVEAERARLGFDDDDDGLQGRAISFPEPEPWPEKVDGAALLDELAATLKRYVVMDEQARYSAALWVVHTYLLDAFMISPRLAVRSPMKRCGKTTLLDVLGCVVMKALPTANVSAAALFRVVEGYRPTLLVDEADTFLAESDDLRGVLNSGHRRGGSVLRTVGDDHEPRAFATYAAVAIGIIGSLPDTLADRSIPIDLKRKLSSEATESFRIDRVVHLEVLARKVARWTADNAVQIAAADPEMPSSVHSRAADNWRPLLAIAEAAGGEWPNRVWAAATQAAAESETESMTELLLGDIRDTFAKRVANESDPADRISSVDLVAALVGIEGRPWAEMGKVRKPLTQNRLARLLKPLAIAPDSVRIDEKRTLKGYYLHQFKEAFERYLGLEGASEPEQRNNPYEMGTSDLFQSGTAETDVPDRKWEKPNNDGPCYVVTDEKGVSEEKSPHGAFFGVEPFDPCLHCGKADGVVHHVRDNRHLDRPTVNLHEACVTSWFARQDGDGTDNGDDKDVDRTCAQCHGEIDGTERLVSVSGRAVWLHLECERFWVRAQRER